MLDQLFPLDLPLPPPPLPLPDIVGSMSLTYLSGDCLFPLRDFFNECVVISLVTGAIELCVLLSIKLTSNSHLQILVNSSYNNYVY